MRIIYLIADLEVGGAQHQLYVLLEQLDKTKCEAKVLTVLGSGYYADLIEKIGIPVVNLTDKRAGVWMRGPAKWIRTIVNRAGYGDVSRERVGDLRPGAGANESGLKTVLVGIRDRILFCLAIFRLLTELRQLSPGVLHCHGHTANLLGAICKKIKPEIRLICTEVDLYLEDLPVLSPIRSMNRYFYQGIDDLILVCNYMRKGIDYYVRARTRIHVVYVYLDLTTPPEITWKDESSLTFSMVCRLTSAKGVDIFLAAIQVVLKRYQHVKFILAGKETGYVASIYGLVKDLEEQGNFVFIVDPAPLFHRIIKETDVFVNPSLTEAMNNSNLQAMAYAKPVIATDVGGTKEAIEQGSNGLLIAPGDVQALSDSIEWMIIHKDQLEEMGVRGRALVEHKFAGSRYIRQHERIYANSSLSD